jgi:DNA-nicking Smr family endonuclease
VKKPHGKGGRKEPVSHDEDLWRYTAATIEPLKRGKPRVHPSDRTLPEVPKSKPLPKPEKSPTSLTAKERTHEPVKTVREATPHRQAPDLSAFDRSSARKIRIGRIDIEARVDLHGLRQSEAHATLRSFLFRCQSRGLRYVLVITGKGKTANSSERVYSGDSERGILKRNVPRWLEEPDVRNIVVSYTTAAIHHGGEGAIYVHLRSRTRT